MGGAADFSFSPKKTKGMRTFIFMCISLVCLAFMCFFFCVRVRISSADERDVEKLRHSRQIKINGGYEIKNNTRTVQLL